MKHCIHLIGLTVLVFAAMSAYFIYPASVDDWEKLSDDKIDHASQNRRAKIKILIVPRAEAVETHGAEIQKDVKEQEEEKDKIVTPPDSPIVPKIKMGNPAEEEQIDKEKPKPIRRTYIVKKGDILGNIAVRMLGSTRYIPDILKSNPGIKPKRLKIGEVIVLPDLSNRNIGNGSEQKKPKSKTDVKKPDKRKIVYRKYCVKTGDTFYSLAKKFCGTANQWKDLKKLNRNITKGSEWLFAGTWIRIPVKK